MNREKVFLLISPKNRTVYNFRGELVRSIIAKGYKLYVTGPNLIDVERIEALGAEFVHIPNNKNGINILADIRYTYKLWRLMRKIRPTKTLGYTIKPVVYGAIAAKLAGVKSINSLITGVGYLFISKSTKAKILKKLAQLLYKVALGFSKGVIFQNSDDRDEFVENRLVKAKKCSIVNGSGVDMTHFTEEPLPQRLTFFMLSRIMHSKGVMEYVEAAKVIKGKYPEVRFMLLGAFEDIQDSIAKAPFLREYVESGILEYFGESSDIRPYYKECSVYVLPSYREGTPRTVLEAMATGRAIITTDAPGCRATVQDGKNGFLVPVKDSAAVAEAMERFILNPTLVETMGAESYRYCHSKYRVEQVNSDMLNIMDIE